MITIDLCKHQALGNDQKAMQQISFTGNLIQPGQQRFLLLKKDIKPFRFFTRNYKNILISCNIKWLNITLWT